MCNCKQELPSGYVLTNATGEGYGFRIDRLDRRDYGFASEAEAVAAAREHYCKCQPCAPTLHDVVLFRVFRRVIRFGAMRSEEHGYTDDLSIALSYKDHTSAALVDVWRGFKDGTGRLYSSKRKPLVSIQRVRY